MTGLPAWKAQPEFNVPARPGRELRDQNVVYRIGAVLVTPDLRYYFPSHAITVYPAPAVDVVTTHP